MNPHNSVFNPYQQPNSWGASPTAPSHLSSSYFHGYLNEAPHFLCLGYYYSSAQVFFVLCSSTDGTLSSLFELLITQSTNKRELKSIFNEELSFSNLFVFEDSVF